VPRLRERLARWPTGDKIDVALFRDREIEKLLCRDLKNASTNDAPTPSTLEKRLDAIGVHLNAGTERKSGGLESEVQAARAREETDDLGAGHVQTDRGELYRSDRASDNASFVLEVAETLRWQAEKKRLQCRGTPP